MLRELSEAVISYQCKGKVRCVHMKQFFKIQEMHVGCVIFRGNGVVGKYYSFTVV